MRLLQQMQPGLPHERGSAQQRKKQETRHGVHPLFEVRGGMSEKGVKAVIEKRKRVRPLARRTRDFWRNYSKPCKNFALTSSLIRFISR